MSSDQQIQIKPNLSKEDAERLVQDLFDFKVTSVKVIISL
jgi:hypothetical protein